MRSKAGIGSVRERLEYTSDPGLTHPPSCDQTPFKSGSHDDGSCRHAQDFEVVGEGMLLGRKGNIWAFVGVCEDSVPNRLQLCHTAIHAESGLDAICHAAVQRLAARIAAPGFLAPCIAQALASNAALQALCPSDILTLRRERVPESTKAKQWPESHLRYLQAWELVSRVIGRNVVRMVLWIVRRAAVHRAVTWAC